jgi:hypothetical protein
MAVTMARGIPLYQPLEGRFSPLEPRHIVEEGWKQDFSPETSTKVVVAMRAMIIALSLILSVAVARGEPASVNGGIIWESAAFDITIVGAIDSTTVDKVKKLFDGRHALEVQRNGGMVAAPGRGGEIR